MPVFKVSSLEDKAVKVTVSANDLVTLLSKAVAKLKLNDGTPYEICDEVDGCVIDEDECLIEMANSASSKGSHLCVVVREVGRRWQCDDSVQLTPQSSRFPATPPHSRPGSPDIQDITPMSSRSSTVQDNATPQRASASSSACGGVLPSIAPFVRDLRNALQSPEHKRNDAVVRARRSVAQQVASIFYQRVSQPGDVKQYAEKICNAVPQAFEISVKSNVACSGQATFVKSVYNMIDYKKDVMGDEPRNERKRKRQEQEIDDPDDVPNLFLDSNGCAEHMWDPVLPEGISEESLGFKHRTLLTLTHMPGCEADGNAERLFKDTYYLQRSTINSARRMEDWRLVFSSWPALLKKTFFLMHCDKLLGKNVANVFYNEISGSSAFFLFMEEYCKKQEQHPSKGSKHELISDFIFKAKEAETNLNRREPVTAAMFPVLVHYMKEVENNLFILMQRTSSAEEIFSKSKETSFCPVLVIQGSSFFDNDPVCQVVIRGEFSIPVSGIIEGMLVLLLSYFAFNISYPETLGHTLEFMQRFFLLINPKKAVRHQSKKRRTSKSTVSAVVAKLSGAIQACEAKQSRWSLRSSE